jgi:hypothetical protein
MHRAYNRLPILTSRVNHFGNPVTRITRGCRNNERSVFNKKNGTYDLKKKFFIYKSSLIDNKEITTKTSGPLITISTVLKTTQDWGDLQTNIIYLYYQFQIKPKSSNNVK